MTGAVSLPGAHIGGQLRLVGAKLTNRCGPTLIGDGMQVDHDMACDDSFSADGEIRLPGAHIRGQLTFTGAKLTNRAGPTLIGDGLHVEHDMACDNGFDATGEVRLVGARIDGMLVLTGAKLTNEGARALSAERLRVGRGMSCGGFTAMGLVSLVGAQIDAHVNLSGATLREDSGRALDAAGLRVSQRMMCDERFSATGEIFLPSAHIGGQLSLASATLWNDCGPALNAAGLRVDQRVLCNDSFSAVGEIRLPGAHIRGQLNLAGARLTNDIGPALSAERLQVEGGMLCHEGFVATSVIRLTAAQIGDELTFADGTLEGPDVALALADARLRGLNLELAARPTGEVDLRGAQIERLIDRPETRPPCRLRGCRYDSLDADFNVSVRDRLDWLSADPDGYSPQPYEQLAEVYRRAGDDEAARCVLIAKQDRRRKEALRGPANVWSWFLKVTVGYGYRLWLAGVWLIVLAVVGSLLFGEVFHAVAKGSGDLTPARDADQVPPFQPVLYTVDVLVPLVNLGQDTGWNAHGAAQWVTSLWRVCGWLLTTALLAGLVIRRE